MVKMSQEKVTLGGVLENFEGPPVSSNAAALELTVRVASPPL